MTIAAIVSLPLGLALAVAGVVWYTPWSLPAILGGLTLFCLGLLYLCSGAIDKDIKEYIDYARKEKDHDLRR